jgi:2-dehydropantoate 2-reductase
MKSVHIEASSDSLLDKVNQVISATANNYSSMHQDIVNARPTELDYITGYVIKVANAQSIDVPVHQRLYNQLQQLDKYHHSSKTTS